MGRLRRAVEARTIERFIECGDPHHGFARIYCDGCGHNYLLAFSCKTRYFCPSCHQKRVLLYGEWVEANVLEPVPHRQYVFTLPKLLRPVFGRYRAWLGELCRIAARLLVDAYAEALPSARPGLILFVQTFGDQANFNPHVHVLAADGAFLPDGTFVFLPAAPEGLLAEGFRRAVLEFLLRHAAISEDLRAKLLGWRHSGFSVHNQVRVAEHDPKGQEQHGVKLPASAVEPVTEHAARAKTAWARLIRKVYEADPLECPKCKGPMRVIALIDDPPVVRRILEHLGRWASEAAGPGPPVPAPEWPANAVIPLTYHAVPDIA